MNESEVKNTLESRLCIKSILTLVIQNFVKLFLEHPGLALVTVTNKLEHVTLLDLQPGSLTPGVGEDLGLGVTSVLLGPHQVVLLRDEDIIDKLLDVSVKNCSDLSIYSGVVAGIISSLVSLLIFVIDTHVLEELEQVVLGDLLTIGHEDQTQDHECQRHLSVLLVTPDNVLSVLVLLVLSQAVDQEEVSLLGL